MIPDEVQEAIDSNPYMKFLYFKALNSRKILELGISKGVSTRVILVACKHNNLGHGNIGHLWSIDWGFELTGKEENPWTSKTIMEIERLKLSKYHTWIKKDILTIPDSWFKKHKFDLIFIDLDNLGPANYMEIVRKCGLSMNYGSKLLLHNIEVYSGLRDALMALIKDGNHKDGVSYKYEEFLHLHPMAGIITGLGIVTKDRSTHG